MNLHVLKLIEKEDFMEHKKINYPKKGAGRRLAARLERLGQQKPPKSLMDKINNVGRKKSLHLKLHLKTWISNANFERN